MEYYDLAHDYFNKHYYECDYPAREYLVFRDFTFSIITWFYETQ